MLEKFQNKTEPNALNNAASIKSPSLDGKVVYTFEARKLRIDPGSPKELRLFYKKPCPYCETLSNEGVEMPQHRKWLERNGSEE
jgi:hypothetical protein